MVAPPGALAPQAHGGTGRLDRLGGRNHETQLNDGGFRLQRSELYRRETLCRMTGESRAGRALDVQSHLRAIESRGSAPTWRGRGVLCPLGPAPPSLFSTFHVGKTSGGRRDGCRRAS